MRIGRTAATRRTPARVRAALAALTVAAAAIACSAAPGAGRNTVAGSPVADPSGAATSGGRTSAGTGDPAGTGSTRGSDRIGDPGRTTAAPPPTTHRTPETSTGGTATSAPSSSPSGEEQPGSTTVGPGADDPTSTPSGGTGTTGPSSPPVPPPDTPDWGTQRAYVVWGASPSAITTAMSAAAFSRAAGVVLVSAHDAKGVTAAAKEAGSLKVPVLLVDGSQDAADRVAREVTRLQARWVMALDADAQSEAAGWQGLSVLSDPADIPDDRTSSPVADLTLLRLQKSPQGMERAVDAAQATAEAAGARVQKVAHPDLRRDTKAIAALAKSPPRRVIGLGPGFGNADTLAARVATASTGAQLPGGGQVMFPGRTLVALYGHPGTAVLGVLGAQGVADSVARAKKVAGQYTKLTDTPVIPAFEIIATMATASPGADGNYSQVTSIKTLKPWVDAATKAGMYVILDLQPGRARLIDQAKVYADLLTNPSVGLALDPEWKLTAKQKPLEQIGGVDASEVNEVIGYLSDLVAAHHLPQKLLVLHQFRLSMLRHESRITTSDDNVSVLIHMDGQGTPPMKESTWKSVVAAAPDGVHFGWKNFYQMDTPTVSPATTMDRKPVPVMISYQ